MKNTTRKQKQIQHHHFLLRMETKTCPGKADIQATEAMVYQIIHEINMKPLDTPKVYYVDTPKYNEGLTAIVPIETSHIAFHFWSRPEQQILKNSESTCLLEFDLYTCGSLSGWQIQKVLSHLTQFEPTHCDVTVLNRKWSLAINKHIKWDASNTSWAKFLQSDRWKNQNYAT
jgi:S-adenosylmethionine/arginine decarboxylase-like enzyme